MPGPSARGRIFYVCADYARPSGGMRRMYRHVHLLNRLGFEAVLVHEKRPFAATWHGYRVPMAWLSDQPELRAEDVVVCTESTPSLLRYLRNAPCRRVVCALHWAPHHLKLKPGESWKDYGVQEVLTPSAAVAQYVEWALGLRATRIGSYVDPALFSHRPGEKTDSIVYMARKDAAGDLLKAAFARRGAPFARYAWHACDDLPEADYAKRLRAARIFLPPSPMEGANVAVLEAMACGCLVVGYHGVGGKEFMRGGGPQRNCVLVDNGDLPAFGPVLEGVLRELAADSGAYASVIGGAVETARPYLDVDNESRSLEAFYARLFAGA